MLSLSDLVPNKPKSFNGSNELFRVSAQILVSPAAFPADFNDIVSVLCSIGVSSEQSCVPVVSSLLYLLATSRGVLDCSVPVGLSVLYLLATGCCVLNCNISEVLFVLCLLATGCNVVDCGIPVILSVLYLLAIGSGSVW